MREPRVGPNDARTRGAGAACLAFLAAALAFSVVAHAEEVPDPWTKGSLWLSLRGGYAKSSVDSAANGHVGFGFGFTRFRNSKWAWGGHVHYEVLGRFGAASEIEMPFTVEVTRHYKWGTPMRPYLGLGGGAFLHKTYRTGADETSMRPGIYVVTGANASIGARSLLGLDVRAVFQSKAESTNPVFPAHESSAIHWSAKLNYARVN